jgi:hypothetical protein
MSAEPPRTSPAVDNADKVNSALFRASDDRDPAGDRASDRAGDRASDRDSEGQGGSEGYGGYDGDTGVESSYRRVTPWALAAFVAGLLSVLAFIGPLMWIVPAAAIAFGVLALRAIQNQPDIITGRKTALAGMALATILLSSVIAHSFAHNQLVTANGQRYGVQWMKLLSSKRFAEAYQLRQSHQNRPSEGTNLIDLYMSGPIKEFYESFTREDVPKRLSALGDDAVITFLSSTYITRESMTMDIVGLRYRVDAKSGGSKPFVVELELAREFFPSTSEGRWHVRRAVIAPEEL